MSFSRSFIELHVRLLNEGADTFRPTRGLKLGGGLFKLVACADYDPNHETWEHCPAQRCAWCFTTAGRRLRRCGKAITLHRFPGHAMPCEAKSLILNAKATRLLRPRRPTGIAPDYAKRQASRIAMSTAPVGKRTNMSKSVTNGVFSPPAKGTATAVPERQKSNQHLRRNPPSPAKPKRSPPPRPVTAPPSSASTACTSAGSTPCACACWAMWQKPRT